MLLKVYLHGQLIQEFYLSEGEDFIAGRGADSDIKLTGEKGISRKHVRFSFDGNCWKAKLLSRFGALISDGESQSEIELTDKLKLHVPPFIIHCENAEPQSNPLHVASGKDANLDFNDEVTPSGHGISANATKQESSTEINSDLPLFDDGNTDPGVSNQTPLLKVEHPSGKVEQFRLEGTEWTIGRDPACEVCIKNNNLSRKHFIIREDNGVFTISDLGSSNGTTLNGNQITAKQPMTINSNDNIVVKKLKLSFLIRQEDFPEMAQEIDESIFNTPALQQQSPEAFPQINPSTGLPVHYDPNQPGAVPMNFDDDFNPADYSTYQSKHKIRAFALLMLPIFAWYLLDSSQPKQEIQVNASVEKGPNIDPEKKEYIRSALSLAQRHYNSGKFSSCLLEVSKVHGILPTGYENSKKLEIFCSTGKEQQDVIREKNRLSEEKRKVDLKVERVVRRCEAKKSTFKSVGQAQECLSEAILLNPEDSGIKSILSFVESKMGLLKQKQIQKAQYATLVRAGELAFEKALKVYETKKYRDAISALEGFIKTTYPDPKNNKSKARSLIKEAESKMNLIIGKGLKECESLMNQKAYRDAMKACLNAQKQDPKNKAISRLKAEIRKRISIKMKELYENASIEENYGNIEASKDMWTKIVNEDFSGGSEYYHKAKLKLKLYGL